VPNLDPRPAGLLRIPEPHLARASARIVEALGGDPLAEREVLVQGLLAHPAAIAPKYFYDALGCALFTAICELPEYYPTRVERSIFVEHRHDIARAAGQGRQFVDLGAGDCGKGAAWIPALRPRRYVAVDIARAAIEPPLARLAQTWPEIEWLGIVTDFQHGLELRHLLSDDPAIFFYAGSSIGNFDHAQARSFLASVHRHCAGRDGSGLLIGVDTKKDAARLVAAYDDALGVTAAFNRNVLNHVNALIGSDFVAERFAHRASYNASEGRIEMHLESMTSQTVRIDGRTRVFAAGERIHTENSYKYSPAQFNGLLRDVGFRRVRCWQDAARDFAVFYAC